MKQRFSFIVALAIAGASFSAFTVNMAPPPAGWYGQQDDNMPYETNIPLTLTQVNSKCPASFEHICAVNLNSSGGVVEIRKSTQNYTP